MAMVRGEREVVRGRFWFRSFVIVRGELRGRDLRYVLTTLLREASRPLTVAELVARCEAEGIAFRGRASKIISDALRWEMGWNRVRRLARGVYCYAGAPRSTEHWIRRRVRALRVYFAQLHAGEDVRFPWPTPPVPIPIPTPGST